MDGRLLRERGVVLGFRTLDERRLLQSVLSLRPGTLVALSGSWDRSDPWPSSLAPAIRPVRVDRLEARERAIDTVAFTVDHLTRQPLMHVLDPCIRNEPWHVWHWWLHDDSELLLSFYDWDCGDGKCCANGSLGPWLEGMVRSGIVELTEPMEFTDEWFDWQRMQHLGSGV
jgi:hypothetical protein